MRYADQVRVSTTPGGHIFEFLCAGSEGPETVAQVEIPEAASFAIRAHFLKNPARITEIFTSVTDDIGS